ncbi:hypothetical protein Tco_0437530, partial [Tanacetum coccineum]
VSDIREKDKNKATNDKTEHGREKRGKAKVKSTPEKSRSNLKP